MLDFIKENATTIAVGVSGLVIGYGVRFFTRITDVSFQEYEGAIDELSEAHAKKDKYLSKRHAELLESVSFQARAREEELLDEIQGLKYKLNKVKGRRLKNSCSKD